MKPVYLIKASIVFCFILIAGKANAQMVGGDIFLKGKYVELGIANTGWYGSDSTAPAGYHPHCASCTMPTGIGFVSDPAMDGWTVGTPAYMGDYFLPGSPFEGWEIQIKGGKRAMQFNPMAAGFAGGMTGSGSNLSYSTSGSTVSGTWVGVYDSIQLTQVTTLNTNQLYFTINVTLTNFSTSPVDSVYYFRTLDPDNDQTWPGGGFPTKNKIEHQSSAITVVSATGLGYPALSLLALGTSDSNATALVYQVWPNPATRDISTMYNQTYIDSGTLYAAGSTNTADYAIGLITFIPHLATVDSAADSVWRTTSTYYQKHPANSASFTFFYAFGQAGLDSAIAKTHLVSPGTLGITNINNGGDVNVYPNPSKDIVNISGLTATDKVTLYDMMGRVVELNWNVTHDGMNTFRYGNIPSGAYLLVVTGNDGNLKSRTPVRKM